MPIIALTRRSPSYSRMRGVKINDRICNSCGQRYGAHYGDVNCPVYDTDRECLQAPPRGFYSKWSEGTPKGNKVIT